jgi:hypothetical protein
MAKTTFVDGVTVVSADFLNATQEHVHDGADADGSAPKVNLFDHVDWGDHAEVVLTEDTTDDWIAELRPTNLNPLKGELVLPTVRVRGELVFGPNSAAATDQKVTTLDRAGVTGPTTTTDWQAIKPTESRRALAMSTFAPRRQSPNGTESAGGTPDVGHAAALYLDNLTKVSCVIQTSTSGGTASLPGGEVQYNAAGVSWLSSGAIELTFADALPAAPRLAVTCGSVTADKNTDAYIYTAQVGTTAVGTAQIWLFETRLSDGVTTLLKPSASGALDVRLHVTAH